jgi:5'-nucleotidase
MTIETEQSARSHALTLSRPLRLHDRGGSVFSIDGTPAECVYFALHSARRVLPRDPDLVVSGLNHGLNLGTDGFYSGTVAAAREGALRGFPALAVSATDRTDFRAAARWVAALGRAVIERRLGGACLLNVNFPPGSEWPIQATRLGTREYADSVEFRLDPRGREYLWLGGPGPGAAHRVVDGSDTAAFDAGAVGITPLVLDLFNDAHGTIAETLARTVLEPAPFRFSGEG